jgi:hypothetical protein
VDQLIALALDALGHFIQDWRLCTQQRYWATRLPSQSHRNLLRLTSVIRNRNTRAAYAWACWQFFLIGAPLRAWNSRPCDRPKVAAWIEDFPGSKTTIKQKLAAVRVRTISGRSANHNIKPGPLGSQSKPLFLRRFGISAGKAVFKDRASCPKPDPKQRIVRTAFGKIMAAATTNDISIKEFTWNAQARFLGTQPLACEGGSRRGRPPDGAPRTTDGDEESIRYLKEVVADLS